MKIPRTPLYEPAYEPAQSPTRASLAARHSSHTQVLHFSGPPAPGMAGMPVGQFPPQHHTLHLSPLPPGQVPSPPNQQPPSHPSGKIVLTQAHPNVPTLPPPQAIRKPPPQRPLKPRMHPDQPGQLMKPILPPGAQESPFAVMEPPCDPEPAPGRLLPALAPPARFRSDVLNLEGHPDHGPAFPPAEGAMYQGQQGPAFPEGAMHQGAMHQGPQQQQQPHTLTFTVQVNPNYYGRSGTLASDPVQLPNVHKIRNPILGTMLSYRRPNKPRASNPLVKHERSIFEDTGYGRSFYIIHPDWVSEASGIPGDKLRTPASARPQAFAPVADYIVPLLERRRDKDMRIDAALASARDHAVTSARADVSDNFGSFPRLPPAGSQSARPGAVPGNTFYRSLLASEMLGPQREPTCPAIVRY